MCREEKAGKTEARMDESVEEREGIVGRGGTRPADWQQSRAHINVGKDAGED